MKQKNYLTRLLRILIHIWWYLSLITTGLLALVFVGTQSGLYTGTSTISFGVEWEMKNIEPIDDLLLIVTDRTGQEISISNLQGKGPLELKFEDGMGYLALPLYAPLITGLGILLIGLYQTKKLFDNLAKGNYFEEINAIRIRRVGYLLLAFVAMKSLINFMFSFLFSIESSPHIKITGIEIGFSPFFITGLLLIVLSEVFREGTKLQSEQALTV